MKETNGILSYKNQIDIFRYKFEYVKKEDYIEGLELFLIKSLKVSERKYGLALYVSSISLNHSEAEIICFYFNSLENDEMSFARYERELISMR